MDGPDSAFYTRNLFIWKDNYNLHYLQLCKHVLSDMEKYRDERKRNHRLLHDFFRWLILKIAHWMHLIKLINKLLSLIVHAGIKVEKYIYIYNPCEVVFYNISVYIYLELFIIYICTSLSIKSLYIWRDYSSKNWNKVTIHVQLFGSTNIIAN